MDGRARVEDQCIATSYYLLNGKNVRGNVDEILLILIKNGSCTEKNKRHIADPFVHRSCVNSYATCVPAD